MITGITGQDGACLAKLLLEKEQGLRLATPDWVGHVRTDPALTRPAEVPFLRGDAAKDKGELGWEPIVTLDEHAAMMVAADLKRIGTNWLSPTQ